MGNTKLRNTAWLEKVELKNYKSIVDLKTTFKPGLNVIIGKNGAGKTNVLEYIDFAWNKSVDVFGNQKFEGNGTFHLHFGSTDRDTGLDAERTEDDVKIWKSRLFPKGGEIRDLLPSFPRSFSHIELLMIPHKFGKHIPLLSEAYNFTSTDTLQEIEESSYPEFIESFLVHLYFALQDATEEGDLESAKSGTDYLINSFEKIDSLLKRYTPIEGFQFSPNYSIREGRIERTTAVSDLVMEFMIGGRWLPFSYLSDGTKRAFLLVASLELSFAGSDFSKELHAQVMPGIIYPQGKVFLIEEPELGIHPHQLHLLMEYLKDKSRHHQIIISTHSPQILNYLEKNELDRIQICTFDSKRGTQLRHLGEEEIQNALHFMDNESLYLSDYWIHADLEPEF